MGLSENGEKKGPRNGHLPLDYTRFGSYRGLMKKCVDIFWDAMNHEFFWYVWRVVSCCSFLLFFGVQCTGIIYIMLCNVMRHMMSMH